MFWFDHQKKLSLKKTQYLVPQYILSNEPKFICIKSWFSARTDFFVHDIPRIRHSPNALYPGIIWVIHFRVSHWLKIGWVIENVLYLAVKHLANVLFVGCHAQRNLCDKQMFYFMVSPVYLSPLSQTYCGSGSLATKDLYMYCQGSETRIT